MVRLLIVDREKDENKKQKKFKETPYEHLQKTIDDFNKSFTAFLKRGKSSSSDKRREFHVNKLIEAFLAAGNVPQSIINLLYHAIAAKVSKEEGDCDQDIELWRQRSFSLLFHRRLSEMRALVNKEHLPLFYQSRRTTLAPVNRLEKVKIEIEHTPWQEGFYALLVRKTPFVIFHMVHPWSPRGVGKAPPRSIGSIWCKSRDRKEGSLCLSFLHSWESGLCSSQTLPKKKTL